jgi:DNA-binding transcriptional LysR family regulator
MDLRHFRYASLVARERSFTRAAQRLHVAQPALSRQVRLLESELGVELLKRTTHEVELTEAGALLLERAPRLLAAADELCAFRELSEATWTVLAARYDEPQLIELCFVVGQYALIAGVVRSLGIETDRPSREATSR